MAQSRGHGEWKGQEPSCKAAGGEADSGGPQGTLTPPLRLCTSAPPGLRPPTPTLPFDRFTESPGSLQGPLFRKPP